MAMAQLGFPTFWRLQGSMAPGEGMADTKLGMI